MGCIYISSHNEKEEYDAERDNFMQSLNLQVIRISDTDVKKNMESVYQLVVKIISKRKNKLKLKTSFT